MSPAIIKKPLIIAIAAVLASAASVGARRAMLNMKKDKKQAAACAFSDEELKRKLSPEQYRIVRANGTEKPFANEYWDNKEAGIYVDLVSGEPLFSSVEKFDSKTGWPSFTGPLHTGAVVSKPDNSLGVQRTEVRSLKADSHLGHVFNDGPGPGGLRYCINSAALRFVPVKRLQSAGLGRYLYLFPGEAQKLGYGRATFAGGCFWGMQAYFKKVPGVLSVRAGYTGGRLADPDYERVSAGNTGHAEAVDIIFDPRAVSYERLLAHFWRIHDPTALNRQGNDTGSQYRAAAFYYDMAQKKAALRSKQELAGSGKYSKPVVTAIEEAGAFYDAEEYHQDYLDKNPGGYCHIDLSGATRG